MYITKKELLAQTGISYGQLYRWKREGLIPEEWFMKKTSRTGQETYLPRELILERIEFIRTHKDMNSMEEMARMLNSHQKAREFTSSMVSSMEEIHPDIAGSVKDGVFSRLEIAFLAVVSTLYRDCRLTRKEVNDLIKGCAGCFIDPPSGRLDFYAVKIGQQMYGYIIPEGTKIMTDTRIEVVRRFQMDEIAGQLAMKYLS